MRTFKYLLIIVSCLLITSSCKQKNEYHEWDDLNVVQKDRIHPHALLIPYLNDSLALEGNPLMSCNFLNLNGNWKFKWVSKAEKASKNFYKPNYDVSKWDEIEVPSNWVSLGYDKKLQCPSTPPSVNTPNPTGSYYTRFEIPESWSNKNVILRFEGVKSAIQIWINGKEAGYSEGSSSPCEFNITPYIGKGENILAARVFQLCNTSYIENQTLTAFSGITQDVFLYALDNICINDISISTDFDEEYNNAELKVDVEVKNISSQNITPQTLTVSLYNIQNQLVLQKSIKIKESYEASSSKQYSLVELVENPQPWSAEKPYLYKLLVSLNTNDSTKSIVNQRIGFREIETKDGVLLINGKPIEFRGVQYAEFSCDKGNTPSRQETIEDIIAMKQNNINSIITKFGPHSPQLYNLCDEYGLYVWDQLDISSSKISTPLLNQTNWKTPLLNKGLSMIHRDKNHPCVIVWSLGNKGIKGENIEALREEIARLDKRPVHCGNFSLQNVTEIKNSTFNIISIGDISPEALNGVLDSFPNKTFVLNEYLMSSGNATGRITEFWDIVHLNKNLLGAFINDWSILALKNMSSDSTFYYKPVLETEDQMYSGLLYPDKTPTPALNEVKFAYQPVVIKPLGLYSGVISITNMNSQYNLKHYDATWDISRDGIRLYGGKIYNLNVEPGKTESLKLPYSGFTASPGKEYFLNISLSLKDSTNWAKEGYEIAWAQFKLPFYAPRPESMPLEYMREIELSESLENYMIRNNECSITINKESGNLTSYQYNDEELWKSGPEINFWRMPTIMDRMEDLKFNTWEKAGLDSLNSKVQYTNFEKLNTKMLRVYFIKTYSNDENTHLFNVYFAYTIYGNGSMEISTKIEPSNYVGTIAKAGLQFTLPKRLNNITWFGKGPYETYPDRSAAKVSIYESTVDQLFEHYTIPQENGNRSEVRWITLADSGNAGLLIQSYDLFNMSAYNYSDYNITRSENDDQLKPEDKITLNIDFEQTGVGKSYATADSKSPYLVYSQGMNFTLYIRPYIPKSTNMAYFMSRRLPGVNVKYPVLEAESE
ncbi:MAG: DUF4981 domain-containing protein [Bacteroidales bacterium]|nr:DUF4981 domain-containing protein [Bacteroidales bacterium]